MRRGTYVGVGLIVALILAALAAFAAALYLLRDVPGRSGIRIHAANWSYELMGCIALGMQIGVLEGEVGLLRSAPAIEKLVRFMNEDSFLLEVRDV